MRCAPRPVPGPPHVPLVLAARIAAVATPSAVPISASAIAAAAPISPSVIAAAAAEPRYLLQMSRRL